jgi:hypothetical protein
MFIQRIRAAPTVKSTKLCEGPAPLVLNRASKIIPLDQVVGWFSSPWKQLEKLS